MNNKRLLAIAAFLDKDDAFIDIGTDHAYIPIYMANLGAKKILATDIHEKAIIGAKKNILAQNLDKVIETKVTDGLENIDTSCYNTLLIAGMGTRTIKHILKDIVKHSTIKKIVLAPNNDLDKMRLFMMESDFALKKEKIIFDKGHYYTIMEYEKGKQNLSKEEIMLGLYNKENKEYYLFLKKKYEGILTKLQHDEAKRRKIIEIIAFLTSYLQKEDGIV